MRRARGGVWGGPARRAARQVHPTTAGRARAGPRGLAQTPAAAAATRPPRKPPMQPHQRLHPRPTHVQPDPPRRIVPLRGLDIPSQLVDVVDATCPSHASLDAVEALPYRGQEPLAQACALLFVPVVGVGDVELCFRLGNEGSHRPRRRIRASTSAHGLPVQPSAFRRSTRRRSSSRCSGVSGTSCGSRLSQSSPIRSSRSSGVS